MSLVPYLPPGLDAFPALLLLISSAITSLVTASMGAGGGVLLLIIMAQVLAPAVLIPVHGMVQMGSNLGRATLTWRHIDWRVIGIMLPATLLGAWLGSLVLIALPPAIWNLAIAAFVLYLCWGPPLPRRALGKPGIFLAGAVTTFLSLFIGSTGPLVAGFIKQIHRDRFRTVATFASAMTLQHAPKAFVFTAAGFVLHDWLWFIAAMIACGAVGTWIGLKLLRRLNDERFRVVFNVVLTLLAVRLVWSGVMGG
ncbi:sulfite exporter TauE/SafE family protein [Hydrocarboniclastica marina]|uniref:Probable membrane transporter protein n=1 Tax=Hydrocarboniclastica marina TaxID=2259620 RepID=A0A4P7XET3_9ALTE|nr:sulfite exporter TauE/SafE family protein [Hydrocarboniclastica marina]MAL98711.1 permease [Alteromonadaceae bacterium]QCF24602.1 sulfite exporter TauE/SafE family protein [Hydrocarboniclastica marina]